LLSSDNSSALSDASSLFLLLGKSSSSPVRIHRHNQPPETAILRP
jgi:hypothetical protein